MKNTIHVSAVAGILMILATMVGVAQEGATLTGAYSLTAFSGDGEVEECGLSLGLEFMESGSISGNAIYPVGPRVVIPLTGTWNGRDDGSVLVDVDFGLNDDIDTLHGILMAVPGYGLTIRGHWLYGSENGMFQAVKEP